MNNTERPQPPHMPEGPGPDAKLELNEVSQEPGLDWLKVAQMAFYASTNYFDSNYRKKLDDAIRAFNSQHPADSKYNSPSYDKRSKIYRPKIRSVMRKNEAAAAAAFFSSMDVVSVTALNQSNKQQLISAELMKELLSYRLSNEYGIPWFQIVLGGLQDAQTQGVVIAHSYWDYEEGRTDKPCCDLIPLENFRFDPASSWMDPVNTSPYLIQLIPMFVGDVKSRMKNPDKRGRTWKRIDDDKLSRATQAYGDSTRSARSENKEDAYGEGKRDLSDYQTVWVQRHIHRRDGEDWEFYTLSDLELLSDPQPLSESIFIKERPYTVGVCVLETHKAIPSSVPELADGLSKESNEVVNQRLDNVKFVLNKGYTVKRGRNVDLAALVRNVPGRVVLADDPETDIKESNWQDVTSSSYQEQDRIDRDMDELLGNFSPMTMPHRKGSETARGMQLLEKPSNMLTEYMLRTFVETFVEPLLRKMVKLEQAYETDLTVWTLAADKAQLFQKYGIDQVTDEMLNQQLTLKVNVGMGATDPATKMQKFMAALGTAGGLMAKPMPGFNMEEVFKELFGMAGYQDGKRFFGGNDPEKAQLKQQIAMLMKALNDKQAPLQAKLQAGREKNMTSIIVQDMKHRHESKHMLAEAFLEHFVAPALNPPQQEEQRNGAGPG